MSSSEDDLLARARAGDKSAFERMVVPCLPTLLAYSRTLCGDYHGALDVVQQTLLVGYRKISGFLPDADLGPWLRGIARLEALKARRQSGRGRSVTLQEVDAVYEDPPPAAEPSRRRALSDCLQSLEGRAREVVQGHYYERLGLATLGRRLGMSAAAVKQLMYRARMVLRDCVRKRLDLEVSR